MAANTPTNSRAGRFIRVPEGYRAFFPNPLPPVLEWRSELVSALSEADRALGRLAGVGQTLVNPHLLIQPFMAREAVLSSRIEGTQSSLSDLLVFRAAPSRSPQVEDVGEVNNYVRALEFGLERVKEFPLSMRLIREIHGELMKNVRGEYGTPGEFRTSQNWIGPPSCGLKGAIFVPPPRHEMNEALSAFEKYLYAPPQLPPLVRLAVAHYQFEVIHPFVDGNGRVGRLLITLLLCTDGLLPQPLLYLSAFFERHRDQYYDLLLGVSLRGAWEDWIIFFLNGVADQAGDAVRRSDRLLALRETFHERLQIPRGSALLHKLVDSLFAYPVISAADARNTLDLTPRATQQNIDRLIAAGILEEITGRKRDRLYACWEIVRAVEAPA